MLGSKIDELNIHAHKSTKKVATLWGRKLEPYVKDVMSEMAEGTPFENTIELIGGQKFPDIIAKKYYGIEVKTTTQNHWKTTGNSVLESTGVADVERIFMLFAKLASPIEFRCRPYEDVLSEVVVTHSPRYLIDMNLKPGETIFDKIKMPYDTIRKTENTIRPIVEYYKSKLKPGEDLWWIESEERDSSSNMVIQIWKNLSTQQKQTIRTRAMTYFPELFGNSNNKFERLAIWLITRESIVCPNIRDIFSAGGRDSYNLGCKTIPDVPRIFVNLFDNMQEIAKIIKYSAANELSEFWNIKTSEKSKSYNWIEIVANHSKSMKLPSNINIKDILSQMMAQYY